MLESLQKLQELLHKLFRADAADLDFGIYRIINYRREQLQTFIDEELPSIVSDALDANSEAESAHEELKKLEKQVRDEFDGDVLDGDGNLLDESLKKSKTVREYLQAREQLGSPQTRDQREDVVYNHLYTFFSRYYDNGDFIPRRRYSQTERYTVPYNGEEVYLHWANRDQYYVKSGEHFSDYRFKSHDTTVTFDLRDVDIEKDNVKGDKRFFIPLSAKTKYNSETDEVHIPFEYRPLTEEEKSRYGTRDQQGKIIDAAEEEILTHLGNYNILSELGREIDGVTPLKKHLRTYTRRNTSDFFIHKDLKKFLNRELDVYIKNEVIPMSSLIFDDVNFDEDNLKRVHWIETAKLIHSIASKIIDFLAHIEEFQKRLWLKKKFVLSTDYCFTLDRVPEEFYPEITENTDQLNEWRDLFAIHEIDSNLFNPPDKEGREVVFSVDFFKENPNLVLDTCHFTPDFKDRLLSYFDNLDNVTDGLLIHGENFQALNLLTEKYRESIKCIHIDPPYNTKTSGFIYKNAYQHSSWLSMMADRLILTEQLMTPDSCILCHIDENEYENLFKIFNILDTQNQGTIIWDKRNPGGGTSKIAVQHEYIVCQSKGNIKLEIKPINRKWILNLAARLIKKHKSVTEECRKEFKDWINNKPDLLGGERLYSNIDDDGKVFRLVHMGAPEQRTDDKYFVPLIHPITKKPCPVPTSGWSNSPEFMQDLRKKNLIYFGCDETTQPQQKWFLEERLITELSSLIPCGEKGKQTTDTMGLYFPYSHPVSLYENLIWAVIPDSDDITLDYFAGSGTSAHATINLNRQDDGKRKYILIEMGHHFDTALMPRIKKAVYAEKWKDAKPASRDSRLSHIIKYQRIESYEDALNNIKYNKTNPKNPLLEDEHQLSYLLGRETRESPTFLNISELEKPFSYKLNIVKDMQTETQFVDLPETFNYLLGISVKTRKCLSDGDKRYLVYHGRVGQRTIVIIWRETKGWGDEDYERDCKFIQENELTESLAEVYVNTNSIVPGAKSLDPLFKRLMFSQ